MRELKKQFFPIEFPRISAGSIVPNQKLLFGNNIGTPKKWSKLGSKPGIYLKRIILDAERLMRQYTP